MENLINTIALETEKRNRVNSECHHTLKKYGARQRVEAGVYETEDSRDLLLNYSFDQVPTEMLEQLLKVLANRHEAQCEWIRICNATVFQFVNRNMPSDIYSNIVREYLNERKLLNDSFICQNIKKSLNKNHVAAVAFAMVAKGLYKYSSRADFIEDVIIKFPEFKIFDKKLLLGALDDLLQKNKSGDFTQVIKDQGTMLDYIKGCYTKTKRGKTSPTCTKMCTKAREYFEKL